MIIVVRGFSRAVGGSEDPHYIFPVLKFLSFQ